MFNACFFINMVHNNPIQIWLTSYVKSNPKVVKLHDLIWVIQIMLLTTISSTKFSQRYELYVNRIFVQSFVFFKKR